MQFINTLIFVASVLATFATAENVIHFHNQDATSRTIYFTASAGHEEIESLNITGLNTIQNVTFPQGWEGNWYAISEGEANLPGMLGEILWNGWNGFNYFDVSAIVNPDDHQGVKILKPMNSDEPISGCQSFPCANAYNKPDDIQTLSTDDNELICLLGNLESSKRSTREKRFAHSFVAGDY
ncbi:hypothetical protein PVAG01_04774 [Phlyctema vagabunda]|uniref:DNase1 protein n=1 Tax=Phlyctema vagabunda TaxID=108571 RepID=A0ABR4PI62_9HELO